MTDYQKYYNYIEAALQYCRENTRQALPAGLCLLVQSYSPLAQWDDIIGLKIYKALIESSYEFHLISNDNSRQTQSTQKAFIEYLQLYNLDI